ncbi:MAG: N-acetylmuramoyl-L-alanine amidase [Candidatus Krumholzibacteria bacterium]|nr:N-acetylmuramoyl-L-alanine amidase [Candidatus Krumholzibacteria bacterium]
MSAPRSYFAILFTVIVGLITLAAGNVPAQIDIWVDPGHGGWDSGAEGFNGPAVPNEKELNIGVASRLENRLTALGYYAYRTQNYDTTYTQPWQRRQIANGQRSNDQGIRSSCRLLISVHMNSVPDASKLGTLTLYAAAKYEGKDEDAYAQDSTVAAVVQHDLMTYADVAFLFCSRDRGIVPDDSLAILKKCRMPAILVEVCFISNGCQWGNIITAGDQELCAEGIAAGVSHYLPILLESPVLPEPVRSVAVATPSAFRVPALLL